MEDLVKTTWFYWFLKGVIVSFIFFCWALMLAREESLQLLTDNKWHPLTEKSGPLRATFAEPNGKVWALTRSGQLTLAEPSGVTSTMLALPEDSWTEMFGDSAWELRVAGDVKWIRHDSDVFRVDASGLKSFKDVLDLKGEFCSAAATEKSFIAISKERLMIEVLENGETKVTDLKMFPGMSQFPKRCPELTVGSGGEFWLFSGVVFRRAGEEWTQVTAPGSDRKIFSGVLGRQGEIFASEESLQEVLVFDPSGSIVSRASARGKNWKEPFKLRMIPGSDGRGRPVYGYVLMHVDANSKRKQIKLWKPLPPGSTVRPLAFWSPDTVVGAVAQWPLPIPHTILTYVMIGLFLVVTVLLPFLVSYPRPAAMLGLVKIKSSSNRPTPSQFGRVSRSYLPAQFLITGVAGAAAMYFFGIGLLKSRKFQAAVAGVFILAALVRGFARRNVYRTHSLQGPERAQMAWRSVSSSIFFGEPYTESEIMFWAGRFEALQSRGRVMLESASTSRGAAAGNFALGLGELGLGNLESALRILQEGCLHNPQHAGLRLALYLARLEAGAQGEDTTEPLGDVGIIASLQHAVTFYFDPTHTVLYDGIQLWAKSKRKEVTPDEVAEELAEAAEGTGYHLKAFLTYIEGRIAEENSDLDAAQELYLHAQTLARNEGFAHFAKRRLRQLGR